MGAILGVTYWRGDLLGVTYWRGDILGVTYQGVICPGCISLLLQLGELLVQGEHSNLWSHFAAPEIYAVMITLEIQCGLCRHLKLQNPSTDGHFITEQRSINILPQHQYLYTKMKYFREPRPTLYNLAQYSTLYYTLLIEGKAYITTTSPLNQKDCTDCNQILPF